MKNIPEKIFLQIGKNCQADDFDELLQSEITWSTERIWEDDIEFVLATSEKIKKDGEE